MPHRQILLVVRLRQVRVAGVPRIVRVYFGPGAVRSPGVQASSGIDRRRDPPRPAIASQLASPTRRPIVFCAHHDLQAFPSLCWVRAEGRGLEPRAVTQIGTRPPGRWCNARRSTAPAPQSKTSKPAPHASWRRCAVGGIQARAENPGRRASSSSTVLRSRRLCEPDLKSFLGLGRPLSTLGSAPLYGPAPVLYGRSAALSGRPTETSGCQSRRTRRCSQGTPAAKACRGCTTRAG